jgi:hypothetical protein
MDGDLPSAERSTNEMGGLEDQLEEIKLDWRPLAGLHQCC